MGLAAGGDFAARVFRQVLQHGLVADLFVAGLAPEAARALEADLRAGQRAAAVATSCASCAMARIRFWYASASDRSRPVPARVCADLPAPAGSSAGRFRRARTTGCGWRGWNTLSTSCARSACIRFSGTFWPLEM
jgi:hypothetical protein